MPRELRFVVAGLTGEALDNQRDALRAHRLDPALNDLGCVAPRVVEPHRFDPVTVWDSYDLAQADLVCFRDGDSDQQPIDLCYYMLDANGNKLGAAERAAHADRQQCAVAYRAQVITSYRAQHIAQDIAVGGALFGFTRTLAAAHALEDLLEHFGAGLFGWRSLSGDGVHEHDRGEAAADRGRGQSDKAGAFGAQSRQISQERRRHDRARGQRLITIG